MAINGYHVWRLWLERRPVELSADEARLYDLTFFPLTRRRFVDLARLGRWADLEAGDVLARPGQPVEEVAVPLTDGVEARITTPFSSETRAGASTVFHDCSNCSRLTLTAATPIVFPSSVSGDDR